MFENRFGATPSLKNVVSKIVELKTYVFENRVSVTPSLKNVLSKIVELKTYVFENRFSVTPNLKNVVVVETMCVSIVCCGEPWDYQNVRQSLSSNCLGMHPKCRETLSGPTQDAKIHRV